MSIKPCPMEPLVISDYCRLTICPECGVVNFNLPSRVSFQFEIEQFLEIANAFDKGAKILRIKTAAKQDARIIELKRKH